MYMELESIFNLGSNVLEFEKKNQNQNQNWDRKVSILKKLYSNLHVEKF